MKKLTLFLLAVPIMAFSQEKPLIVSYINVEMPSKPGSKIKGPVTAVVLSNGDTVAAHSMIRLGKGSLPNGDYNYIATASNTMAAKLKRTTKLQEIWLERIKRRGDEIYGYKYFFQAEGRYLIQLENAIVSGEIILKNP